MAKPSDLMVDGDLVRALAALLEETGLSEIEFSQGDRRIRVARNSGPASAVTVSMPWPTLSISSRILSPAEMSSADVTWMFVDPATASAAR